MQALTNAVRPMACLLLFALLEGGLPRAVRAQVGDTLKAAGAEPVADTVPAADSTRGISPRGAFLRSLVLPGWGHAQVGAPLRGAFYFASQSATAFMLFKTQTRLERARNRLRLREEVVRTRLAAQGISDPDQIEQKLAEDPEFEDLSALEETRSEQREDWLALGIFLLFLGGADAYVSAHLAHFPAAVEVGATPTAGVTMEVRVPIPPWR